MGAVLTVAASALANTNNGALTIPGFTPRETRVLSSITAHTQVVKDSKGGAVALRFLRWYFSVSRSVQVGRSATLAFNLGTT